MAIAIGMMCKAPRAGFAKTRLARAIGAEAAARLAAAFIADSAVRALAVAEAFGGVAVALHAPADAAAEIAALLPPGFGLAPQPEGDLGARMAGGFAALFAAGHGPVLITGTDIPTLPDALLRAALSAVLTGRVEAAAVPVLDGGYCALALARPVPALFQGITWSTPLVMAATEAAALRAGIAFHRTPPWYDVDDEAGLDMLRAELAGTAPAGCAVLAGHDAVATRQAV